MERKVCKQARYCYGLIIGVVCMTRFLIFGSFIFVQFNFSSFAARNVEMRDLEQWHHFPKERSPQFLESKPLLEKAIVVFLSWHLCSSSKVDKFLVVSDEDGTVSCTSDERGNGFAIEGSCAGRFQFKFIVGG